MEENEKRTVEQKRAAHALAFVTELKEGKHGDYGKFKSYVSGLPATIVMNGLGQAMATELSSKEKGHEKLFDIIRKWLLIECKVFPRENHDLMKAITSHGQDQYLRAQAEALAYLIWLKKFSQAYLKGDG